MAGQPPHEPRRAAQHARRAELEGQLLARDAASAGKAGPHPSGRFCPGGQDLRPAIRPHWSKAELFAKSAAEHLEKDQLPQMLEAMAETSAGELDTERLSNVMAALVRESKGKANAKLLDRLEDILQEVEEA